MRVRISFDALRLCLLVAAGVTSGYLWRAAFESSAPAEDRTAAAPRIVEQAPAPPVVHIVPHHLTTVHRATVTRQAVQPRVVRATRHAPTTLISSHAEASSPPVVTPASTPPPKAPPPSKPSPAPTPASSPPTTTTTAPVAAPVQQAAPPPATTTTQTPPPTTSEDTSRPGWGKGDKNHDHDGPGGNKP